MNEFFNQTEFTDRAQVKPEPVKPLPPPAATLTRHPSLSTILEEHTSQLHDTTMDDRAEVSFSFDGKEVSVSLYETPDLTEEEALQVVEMYAEELSEHISGKLYAVTIIVLIKSLHFFFFKSI